MGAMADIVGPITARSSSLLGVRRSALSSATASWRRKGRYMRWRLSRGMSVPDDVETLALRRWRDRAVDRIEDRFRHVAEIESLGLRLVTHAQARPAHLVRCVDPVQLVARRC